MRASIVASSRRKTSCLAGGMSMVIHQHVLAADRYCTRLSLEIPSPRRRGDLGQKIVKLSDVAMSEKHAVPRILMEQFPLGHCTG